MAPNWLAEQLAEIAREIHASRDAGETADEICAAVLGLIPKAASAGVALVSDRRRLETIGASSEVARIADRWQQDLHEGPCFDTVRREPEAYAPVLASDERWPLWAPRVAERLGVEAMVCLRLFTKEDRLGALTLYSTDRYAFDDDDRDTARLVAAHAAVAIASARQIDNLKIGMDRRVTIGTALGIIMCRYDLADTEAFAVLRRLSSHGNRKLYDVAADVVDHVRLPPEDVGGGDS
jgi:GAF domain-containing protein